MSKEQPNSYKIKAVCKNCGTINEIEVPFGVGTSDGEGIYFSKTDSLGDYWNVEKRRFQGTAWYPHCNKCGSVSLQKTLHLENAIELLERKLDSASQDLNEIKRHLELR